MSFAYSDQFPRLPNWLPEGVAPHAVEFASLLGPLARMGIFSREWVRELFPV
jgi:hypothetical protein